MAESHQKVVPFDAPGPNVRPTPAPGPKQVVAGIPIQEILIFDVAAVLHARHIGGQVLGNPIAIEAGGMVLILGAETATQMRAALGIQAPTIVKPA